VAGPFRQTAVVLCYPFGHEYIHAHRAYRHLARALTESGFPVLRFDYSGCGDSAGGVERTSLQVWTDDLVEAIDAIHARCTASSLCLIGGRLGASIALRVADRREDVSRLVLWDPVVDGRRYLERLEQEHGEMLSSARVPATGEPDPDGGTEILGFVVSEPLRRELHEAPDALATPSVFAGDVLLLHGAPDSGLDGLAERLGRAGATVARRALEGEQPWTRVENVTRAVLPLDSIRSIVSWVGERCP